MNGDVTDQLWPLCRLFKKTFPTFHFYFRKWNIAAKGIWERHVIRIMERDHAIVSVCRYPGCMPNLNKPKRTNQSLPKQHLNFDSSPFQHILNYCQETDSFASSDPSSTNSSTHPSLEEEWYTSQIDTQRSEIHRHRWMYSTSNGSVHKSAVDKWQERSTRGNACHNLTRLLFVPRWICVLYGRFVKISYFWVLLDFVTLKDECWNWLVEIGCANIDNR